jgi:hypothetical protein
VLLSQARTRLQARLAALAVAVTNLPMAFGGAALLVIGGGGAFVAGRRLGRIAP